MVQPLLLSYILCIFIIVGSSSANTTESALLNTTDSDYDLPPHLVGKDKSLLTCTAIGIKSENFELLSNGSAQLLEHNILINDTFYAIMDGSLYYCPPKKQDADTPLGVTAYITVVGLLLSMIGLLLHLIVFCIVSDLRNLPGWNLATLCACLFTSYLLILVIGSGELLKYSDACAALACVTHFFLFSSFLWMSIMSFDVFMTFLRATGSFRNSSSHFSKRKFGLYCLCAFGIALLFNIFSVLADKLVIVPEEYRPKFHKKCWFSQKMPLLILFVGPFIILSCLNFILFGACAYILHANKRKCDLDAHQPAVQRRYLMYFRLSVIMGVTWIVGIAANIVDMDWLWFIFVLLNTLQGFFIFLAFTCSKKVKKYFRQKFLTARASSEQTLTPTFQTYSAYSNSIERDLDKTVESSK